MAKKRQSCNIAGRKYPSADKIGNRTSTIARSMACTITQRIPCDEDTEKKWLDVLGQDPNNLTCAYCGDKATHLDHLHPLIKDTFPTGWGTEPGNLVPCCSSCNSKKKNVEWGDFMDGKLKEAKNKQAEKEIRDRIKRINDLENDKDLKPSRNEAIDDPKLKAEWKAIYDKLCKDLDDAQKLLEKLIEPKQKGE